MAPTSFPCTCPDHPAFIAGDASDWHTHITSEHPTLTPDQLTALEARIVYTAPGSTTAVPKVRMSNVYAKYGLSPAKLASRTSDSLCGANLFTKDEILEFVQHFGGQLDNPVTPTTIGDFSIDFFELILRTAATDQLSGAGGFLILDDNGNNEYINWEVFFNAGKRFFSPKNKIFKPRRVMRSIEDLLAALWDDPKIEALEPIRRDGTALSRQLIMTNGQPAPAWVAVPDLFNHKLTPEFIELRKKRAFYSNTSNNQDTSITRFDELGEGQDAERDYNEHKVGIAKQRAELQNALHHMRKRF